MLMGASIPRLEDNRLLTGQATFVADMHLPRMLEVAVVRSQIAHARILSIDTSSALELEGVVDVVTAGDLVDVAPVPDFPDWARPVATFPLCRERARYVGAPLAAVVAEDRYAAEDGAELVVAELEPLPAVASIDEAVAPGALRPFEEWPDNRVVDSHVTNPAVEGAFERLRVIGGSYYVQRHGAVPMECRGVLAEYRDGRLTIWTGTQFPHIVRTMLSYVLPLPERNIRVVAPDVGGGFGLKAQIYPEEYVVPYLAMRLRRPVRWLEDRYEHLISACHARDTRIDLSAAVDDEGRIAALRGTIWQDVGSGEIYPNGYNTSFVASGSLTGPYRIPEQAIDVVAVVTNKTPSGAYRGFGIPEAAWAMERLVEKIARDLDLDALDLRRSMIISPEELPYVTASGARIDSGSHLGAFDAAVDAARRDYDGLHAQAQDPRTRIGMGIATYVEGVAPTYFGTSGHWTSHDAGQLRFDPDGGVTVAVGVVPSGQGLQTMVATLTAEELGLPIEDVRVVMGDTDTAPYGLGSWGSRSTVVVGGAVARAAVALRTKATAIAAHMLEASPEDIEMREGAFRIRGADQRAVTWRDIATVALIRTLELPADIEPGLEAQATYDPPGLQHVPDSLGRMNGAATYTNATHAAIVRVDLETGEVTVLRYIVAHDCGRVLHPQIVDGQVFGGVAQGIGGTLSEEFAYDEDAQPQATTLMDYLLPTACEVPAITTLHFESPAPEIPHGVKGAGEAGIIGPAPAIAAAVEDALAEFAIDEITSTPITPAVVCAAIRRARAGVAA